MRSVARVASSHLQFRGVFENATTGLPGWLSCAGKVSQSVTCGNVCGYRASDFLSLHQRRSVPAVWGKSWDKISHATALSSLTSC